MDYAVRTPLHFFNLIDNYLHEIGAWTQMIIIPCGFIYLFIWLIDATGF